MLTSGEIASDGGDAQADAGVAPRETGVPSAFPRTRLTQIVAYALLLLIVIGFGLVRWRFRNVPLERDEGEYAYAGQLMLQGIPPYQLAYTMKMPGIFAAYAASMAAFGQTPAGIRTGLLLANAMATVLMFFLARRLFGWTAAVVASACYALLSTSYVVLGMFAHATQFVVPLALAGMLLLLEAMRSRKAWLYFASGLLFGAAFLMKQPGGAFLLFAVAYLIGAQWRAPLKTLAARLVMLVCGAAVPVAATGWLLYRAGVFPTFWFWTVDYARAYASEVPLSRLPGVLAEVMPQARSEILLGVLVLFGVSAMFWSSRARSHRMFLSLLLVLSALSVAPGLYFRPHYFVLLLPALCLLIAAGIAAATDYLRARGVSRFAQAIPALVFLLAFAATLFWQGDMMLLLPPAEVGETLYPGQPFAAAQQIGDYIRQNTAPAARVAVFGSEPEIYFYAQRHAATGYIYLYPLNEPQPYAAAMRQQLMDEVERARPEIVVLVFVEDSWLLRPGAVLDFAERYVQQGYRRVGVVDVDDFPQVRSGAPPRHNAAGCAALHLRLSARGAVNSWLALLANLGLWFLDCHPDRRLQPLYISVIPTDGSVGQSFSSGRRSRPSGGTCCFGAEHNILARRRTAGPSTA